MYMARPLNHCVSLILVLSAPVFAVGCRDRADVTADSVPIQALVDIEPGIPPDTTMQTIPMAYEAALKRYAGASYDTIHAAVGDGNYAAGPAFDPTAVKYFDRARDKLQLTNGEIEMFSRNGFVVLDMNRRHAFPQVYHQIYNDDLPVLITTDSVLHAVHITYDQILMELEKQVLKPAIDRVLQDARSELARQAHGERGLKTHWQDVDLYLTVAVNLLHGRGGAGDQQNDKTLLRSQFGQDEAVAEVLSQVRLGVLQFPERTPATPLYGGQRYVDYSQFTPRGHYAADPELNGYFRCMMWLGRADCGWNVLPSAYIPCISFDADRELRDAMLLTMLLHQSGGLARLATINNLLTYLVGHGDELSPATLYSVQRKIGIARPNDVYGVSFGAVRTALAGSGLGEQAIRSQVVISEPNSPVQVLPPAVFQLFGQRFCADSFVLSKVVYDSILYEGRKQERMMPTGLDVMAALGHDVTASLLEPEVRKWNYAGNFLACRTALAEQAPAFWESSFYNGWLDAIRQTGQELRLQKNAPQAMKTRAWTLKQLQAGLGGWSELRHDNQLYAKQSYTAGIVCEYPSGFVEPYPAVYARLRQMTSEAGRRLGMLDIASLVPPDELKAKAELVAGQANFLTSMSDTFMVLETLARKELAAEPFAESERQFLRRTVEITEHASCGSPPKYDGWYYRLLYGPVDKKTRWSPTVADVHTDPNSEMTLHVAVGDARMCVIAVDNEGDRCVYVGPVYSYYEFQAPAGDRMTDEAWQERLMKGAAPPAPAWTAEFQSLRRSQPNKK